MTMDYNVSDSILRHIQCIYVHVRPEHPPVVCNLGTMAKVMVIAFIAAFLVLWCLVMHLAILLYIALNFQSM